MTETVSTLEIVWTVIAAIGLLTCGWLFRDATKSRLYWETEGLNGGTDTATRSNVRSSAVRTFRQLLNLILGLTSMTFPPSENEIDPAFLYYILPGLFIAGAIIDVVDAIYGRRDRERILTIERGRNLELP